MHTAVSSVLEAHCQMGILNKLLAILTLKESYNITIINTLLHQCISHLVATMEFFKKKKKIILSTYKNLHE